MFAIVIFGLLMMIFSLTMVISPEYWSKRIILFSEFKYFHPFEIVSRLSFGVLFLIYSHESSYPNMILGIGYLLIAVAIGLLLTPPSKHKVFAVWSAEKFKHIFRPAGIISFIFGLFILYTVFPIDS